MPQSILDYNPALTVDALTVEWIPELIKPEQQLAVAIIAEEQDLVLITRSVLTIGRVELILPGCWDVVVAAGDFAGMVLDMRKPIEDMIVLCDAINLHYNIEM